MQYIEYVLSKERELSMSEEFTINVQNSEFTISVDGDAVYTVELGTTGARGKAGTIAVGEVTSIDTFADPTVENVGTIEDAIFNFGIPRGKGLAEGAGIDIVDVDNVQTISVDKTELSLDQVDNTSDANKPISTATATALGNKVDKVAGKGLSTNDLTDTLKGNYDTAYTNTHTHSNKTILDAIQESLTTTLKSNYDTAYSHSQTTGNPHNTTPAHIGLGNVNNTSDADKPVSTAQQTALNLKANQATTYTKTAVDTSIGLLVPKTTTVNSKALSDNITLSTADIADSTNKRYCTDAQKTVISNTSNTNTGDETNATIKTKLGVVSASNEGYVTPTQKASWDSASGTSGKVLVSATDTTSDYLGNKISAGYGVNITTTNAGANEVKSIALNNNLYGTCSTASVTSAKEVTISGLTLVAGVTINVEFTNGSVVSAPTLNVNGGGALAIYKGGTVLSATNLARFIASSSPKRYIKFLYDGTKWNLVMEVLFTQRDAFNYVEVWSDGYIKQNGYVNSAISAGGATNIPFYYSFGYWQDWIGLTGKVATDANGSGAPSLCSGASTSATTLYVVNEGDRSVTEWWWEAKGY